MIAKCSCQHCNGHIEFDAQHAGQTADCPHCGLGTVLFIPPPPQVHAQPTKSKSRVGLVKILLILAVAVCLGAWLASKLEDKQVKHLTGPPAPDFVPEYIPPQKQAANQNAEEEKHIAEAVQRVTDHHNSASEVAYRQKIATKEHFQHLERMNAIESGKSDVALEVMKLRQQEEIKALEDAHAITEADWKRQEEEWDKAWWKAHE